MPFERKNHADPNSIESPKQYVKMIEKAKKLSQGAVISRIDLYEINAKGYFGENALYPGRGFDVFRPIHWDYILGSWLKLPTDTNCVSAESVE